MMHDKIYDKKQLLNIDNWTLDYKNATNTMHMTSNMEIRKFAIAVTPRHKIELSLICMELGYQNFDNHITPMSDFNLMGTLYRQIGENDVATYEIMMTDESRNDNMSAALINALTMADTMIDYIYQRDGGRV